MVKQSAAPGRLATREDCRAMLEALLTVLARLFPDQTVDCLVYGAYLRDWRIGLSDLDAMIYFADGSLCRLLDDAKITKWQAAMAGLYRRFAFLANPDFLEDVFIMDRTHGQDGRFMVHDADSFNMFLANHSQVLLGVKFFGQLRPMTLRNQDELYLANGLHLLRQFLLFEVPRGKDILPVKIKEAAKFLRVLPRIASKILNEPADPIPEALNLLKRKFPEINYRPLEEFWRQSQNYQLVQRFQANWHLSGHPAFINCWRCYELTLEAIVRDFPSKSRSA